MAVLRMIKQPRFIIGFVILAALLAASFTYQSFVKPHYPIKTSYFIYNKTGELIGTSPFHPAKERPFGTDKSGVPYELRLIEGAKYTICLALGVAFVRFVGSLLLAMILTFLNRKAYGSVYYLLNTFNYIPSTFLAFVILAPIDVIFVWNFTPMQQVVISFIVLCLIGLPNLTILFAEEMRDVKRREFIVVAKTLGCGPFHIMFRHIFPYIRGKLIVIFNQQVVQILVILVALALVGVRVGGTVQDEVQEGTMNTGNPDPSVTQNSASSQEWSGLIEQYRDQVWGHNWLLYEPAIAFCVTIIAIQLITSAIRRVVEREDFGIKWRKRSKPARGMPISEEAFAFVERGVKKEA